MRRPVSLPTRRVSFGVLLTPCGPRQPLREDSPLRGNKGKRKTPAPNTLSHCSALSLSPPAAPPLPASAGWTSATQRSVRPAGRGSSLAPTRRFVGTRKLSSASATSFTTSKSDTYISSSSVGILPRSQTRTATKGALTLSTWRATKVASALAHPREAASALS